MSCVFRPHYYLFYWVCTINHTNHVVILKSSNHRKAEKWSFYLFSLFILFLYLHISKWNERLSYNFNLFILSIWTILDQKWVLCEKQHRFTCSEIGTTWWVTSSPVLNWKRTFFDICTFDSLRNGYYWAEINSFINNLSHEELNS